MAANTLGNAQTSNSDVNKGLSELNKLVEAIGTEKSSMEITNNKVNERETVTGVNYTRLGVHCFWNGTMFAFCMSGHVEGWHERVAMLKDGIRRERKKKKRKAAVHAARPRLAVSL